MAGRKNRNQIADFPHEYVAQLRQQTARKMTQGELIWDIKQWLIEDINCSQATAQEIIRDTRKLLREAYTLERKEWMAKLLAMAEHTFKNATADRQHAAAIGAINTLARMTGVDAPKR